MRGGSVVNAASIAGMVGMAKSAPYVASKVCAVRRFPRRGLWGAVWKAVGGGVFAE